jgi:hypothetical protein
MPNPRYYLFDCITDGEKSYIKRYRLKKSTRTYAKQLEVGEKALQQMESCDTISAPFHLELWEECVIYMRRHDIRVQDIAYDMLVWRTTVHAWRNGKGDYDKLFRRLMDDKNGNRILEGVSPLPTNLDCEYQ